MYDIGLLINGADVQAEGGATFDRLDPISGGVATRAPAAAAADIDKAVAAAEAAFDSWSETGPTTRRTILLKAADELQARADDFSSAMMGETGSTDGWARFNVMLAAGMLREAAAMTTQISGEVIPSDKPGCLAMAMRQPVGVILSIAPWNAPVILAVRAIALPIACGNTVVLKASEACPRTHHLIGQVMQAAGLPDGVLNVVSNAPEQAAEVVRALVEHPAVKRINFTGSTRVGKIIAKLAAEHLKPCLLELGGKAPMLVLDDADLDAAADAAIFGAFANQGQICMSTERIVVDASIADAFLEKFAAKARIMTAGDPREAKAPLGAVVSREAAECVGGLIADAVAKGAVVAAGGDREGVLLNATILDRVTPQMRIYAEESFGPVVTVVRVAGEAEAIRVANDTEYGLSSAVFSHDVTRALRVARKIQSGICHINGPTVGDEPQMPFGGVKGSGYGRFGGKAGVDQFTELRWITIETPSAGH